MAVSVNWSVCWLVGKAFVQRSTQRTSLAYLALFFYFSTFFTFSIFLHFLFFYILQRRPPMNVRMQMAAAPTPASTLRKAITATVHPIWSLMRQNQLTV